jgi:hypothetical protein
MLLPTSCGGLMAHISLALKAGLEALIFSHQEIKAHDPLCSSCNFKMGFPDESPYLHKNERNTQLQVQ